MEILLTRNQFRESVFKRDKFRCVRCGETAVDAHHILDRKLFKDGGYYLNNGVSLCSSCHIDAERSVLSCELLREDAKIKIIVAPEGFDPDYRYDKWGKMLDDRTKYPKTMHLHWSPNLQNDDRMLEDPNCFNGKSIVMTEKMDGENTTMYRDAIHARSAMNMAPHPSRTWVQALHGKIKHDIPIGYRICGENLYAKHSIHYKWLHSYFQVFSIWDGDICLDYDETVMWCNLLGLQLVPHIYGPDRYSEENVKIMGDIWVNSIPGADQVEGYVVRNADSFHAKDFQTNVAKYVRKGHVQTSEHWLNEPMVKNELAKSSNPYAPSLDELDGTTF